MKVEITFSESELDDIYQQAVSRYMVQRRSMVTDFVQNHYSFKNSTELHRHSLGWDILKTPVNAIASALTVVKQVGAFGIKKLGAEKLSESIDKKNLFLATKIGKEIQWNIQTKLLELPSTNGDIVSNHDALLEEIFRDERIQKELVNTLNAFARQSCDDDVKKQIKDVLADYTGSRAAASDITVSLMTAATGLATLNKLTPGLASLSNYVATGIAHSTAIHSFWAGPWAGGLYYSLFNVATPSILTAGVFTGMLVPASFIATFAGIIADPVQKKLGLHAKKLSKVLDSTEQILLGDDNTKLEIKDHYVARIFDLLDWTQLIIKAVK